MSEFAYTFTYTPTLTTRRAPVYVDLLRASALIMDLTMRSSSKDLNDFKWLVVKMVV